MYPSAIRYGFTESGFVVVDDNAKIGEFAYYSSPHWERACRNPEAVAVEMLRNTWKAVPASIQGPHYLHCCEAMNRATRWPVSAK